MWELLINLLFRCLFLRKLVGIDLHVLKLVLLTEGLISHFNELQVATSIITIAIVISVVFNSFVARSSVLE